MTEERYGPPRDLFEWQGGTTGEREAASRFSGAGVQDMGPLVARFSARVPARMWRTGIMFTFDVWLVLSLVRAALGTREHFIRDSLGILAIALVVVLVLLWRLAWVARGHHHDVHRHGLVLRAPGGAPPEVVPWRTIDPGRVFVRSVAHTSRRPRVLMRRACPPAVVLNGWVHREGSTRTRSLAHRYRPGSDDRCFGWWQLGVADPGALLTAIEFAMVADGYPAAGVTPFALSRTVDPGTKGSDPAELGDRRLEDPVIGLPRPWGRGSSPQPSGS